MGKYKVNYKLLTEQGNELLEISKQLLQFADDLKQTASNLGSETELAQIRTNLNEGSNSMEEFNIGLSTAADQLKQIVEKYTASETRGTQRMDGCKAHNRDFYKSAVAVPSAGVAANIGVAAQVQSINVNVDAVQPAAAAAPAAARVLSGKGASGFGSLGTAGVVAATAVAGAAVGVGAVASVKAIKKNKKQKDEQSSAVGARAGRQDAD